MAGGTLDPTAVSAYEASTAAASDPTTTTTAAVMSAAPAVSSSSGSTQNMTEEERRRIIDAHSGYLGTADANAADWQFGGNLQTDPVMDRSIRAQLEAARAAAVSGTTPQTAAAASPTPAAPQDLGWGSNYKQFATGGPQWTAQYAPGDPTEMYSRGEEIGGEWVTPMGGEVFGRIAEASGMTPEEAQAAWGSANAQYGMIENAGLKDKLPVEWLIGNEARVPQSVKDWWAREGEQEMEKAAQTWQDSMMSGSLLQDLMPALSVIAPFALGPALAAAGFATTPATALGAGLDAFGAAVPAGFAVTSGGTAGALGAGLGAGAGGAMDMGAGFGGDTLSALGLADQGVFSNLGSLWDAYSTMSPAEKQAIGQLVSMGKSAITGEDLNPMDFAFGMSPGIGAGLSGMLTPALGNLGGQLGSQFLMNLGKGALSGGDFGDVLKKAGMGAGLGAAGAGIAAGIDGIGGMGGADLGAANGGWDVLPEAVAAPAAGGWNMDKLALADEALLAKYAADQGINMGPGYDLSALAGLDTGMLGYTGQTPPISAPQAPTAPAPQQPQAPRGPTTGQMVATVGQKALGVLQGMMGGDEQGQQRAQAPQRQEGQSDQQYQQQVESWAVDYLGLDAKTMAQAGLTPGTPQYMDYIMKQADDVIAQLGVDPEFLDGASVEEMQQQFRTMSGQQMNQLYRALTVRGQMSQMTNADSGIDPFTGMREEFGGNVQGNRDVAATQRGIARRADALAQLRGKDARDFLTGMLGERADLYDMGARRIERDKLALMQEEEDRAREDERKKRNSGRNRRVTKQDLDSIFGVGY